MNEPPATRLHDVVVVHEQSGAAWQTDSAHIRGGRIVLPVAGAPDGFFDAPAATFRIDAFTIPPSCRISLPAFGSPCGRTDAD